MPSEREKIAELIELALDPYWSGLRREPSLTEVEWRVVIAALRAQDREDGAREMRERAAKAADDWLSIWGGREIRHTSAREYASDAVADVRDVIAALPLSTRTEDGDA